MKIKIVFNINDKCIKNYHNYKRYKKSNGLNKYFIAGVIQSMKKIISIIIKDDNIYYLLFVFIFFIKYNKIK
jgi:hypothetical protein